MKPFSVEEIRSAVFGCDRSKSSSPNGFSMAFFQDNWNFLKGELEINFKEFFERGILSCSISKTFVCLIPKKDRTERVRDFRPSILSPICIKLLLRSLQIISGVCFPQPFRRPKVPLL